MDSRLICFAYLMRKGSSLGARLVASKRLNTVVSCRPKGHGRAFLAHCGCGPAVMFWVGRVGNRMLLNRV